MKFLSDEHKVISLSDVIEPQSMPTEQQLLAIHTKEYLDSLKSSVTVAQITEVFIVASIPNFLVWNFVLNPMLYATSGTIAAAEVALDRGFAINLGGGFHHCCSYQGGGFCPFADITLSLHYIRKYRPNIKNVMIIDLDAHQGNGHERDKLKFSDNNIYILDMYNKGIYPGDSEAKRAINREVKLSSGCTTDTYINELCSALEKSRIEDNVSPDIIIFNAGTDILDGDPLGRLCVSAKGVIKRDELVFGYALERKIPIVMVLSGGYQKSNAAVIAQSITNLHKQFKLLDKNWSLKNKL